MKLTEHIFFYSEKGLLDCNTYVIKDGINVIIDPGLEQYLPQLIEEMKKDGINPEDISIITNTHLHMDHCWADEAFKKISGAKILFHPLQRKFYHTSLERTSKYFGFDPLAIKEDAYLESKLKTGDLEFEILPTPGHSPDSICFYCKNKGVIICGDLVFNCNTGRVDLPGGSAEKLKQSIEGIAQLNIELLLPGHMEPVKGRENVRQNFTFIREQIFPWL